MGGEKQSSTNCGGGFRNSVLRLKENLKGIGVDTSITLIQKSALESLKLRWALFYAPWTGLSYLIPLRPARI